MESNSKNSPVIIRIGIDGQNPKTEGLQVYVVDSNGKIIDSAPIKANTAYLKSTKESLEGHSKIYVSQPIPEALLPKSNEAMLAKAGAYQITKSFNDNFLDIARLPGIIFRPWHHGNCLMQGNVSNTITIDGRQVTVPVCNARVHLVEVETELIYRVPPYYYIKRIPDWVINEIGINIHYIKDHLKLPPQNIPIPNPIGPVTRLENVVRLGNTTGFEKLNMPLQNLDSKIHSFKAPKLNSLPPLADHILQGLSASIEIAKQTLIKNYAVLYPYICLWPHLWYWIYEWDEDNITYTDCNGHFEYWENTVTEDGSLNIYTWIEVLVNGIWTTVYRPYSIPCSTWWNYPCNSPININLHNASIPICMCDPLPNGIVWIKRVGNISLRNIMLELTEAGKTSLFVDGRGLTNAMGIEGSSYVSPFTGGFSYAIQFGDPVGSATHYRWKYRRITDGFLNAVSPLPGFKYMDGALTKPYTYKTLDAGGNPVFNTGFFTLGVPIGSGKIYKIPHTDADVDAGDPTAEWKTQDTDSIIIGTNTDNLIDGIYEFMLEICNSAGVVQTVANNVFEIDLTPQELTSTPAINVNADYIFPGGGAVTGFRFVIRIDNNHTTANIFNAEVLNQNGTVATTDTLCGFAKYQSQPDIAHPGKQMPVAGDNLELLISAVHLHRYGKFSFGVTRGNSGNVFSRSNQVAVPPALPTDPTFTYSPSLSTLLGGCDKAAFAENLNVYAYHTDGSIRVEGFDSGATAAFAVEPDV